MLADISERDLCAAIENLIFDLKDCTYVASSIAALAASPEPEYLALSSLYQTLGSKGTLIMPTGSNSFRKHGFFDRENTPSDTGVLTERFRFEPHVLRSFAPPFNAVCAKGPQAEEICSIQSETAFGRSSVYDYLITVDASVLLLGCSFNDGVAHMHWLEERHGSPYREWREHRGVIITNGTSAERSFRHYTRRSGYKLSYKPLEEEMERMGALRHASVGLLSLSAFSLSDFSRVLDEWFPLNVERTLIQ